MAVIVPLPVTVPPWMLNGLLVVMLPPFRKVFPSVWVYVLVKFSVAASANTVPR